MKALQYIITAMVIILAIPIIAFLFIGMVILFLMTGPKNIPLINDDNLNYKYDDSKSENGISKI